MAIVNLGVLFHSLLMQLLKMRLEGSLLLLCPCTMSLHRTRRGLIHGIACGTDFLSVTGSIWEIREISTVKTIHVSSVWLENMTCLSRSRAKNLPLKGTLLV